METLTLPRVRRWLRAGLTAALGGPLMVLLALGNLVLFVMVTMATVMLLVPGVGLLAFSGVVRLVRIRTDLERRLAAKAAITVNRPYRPVPEQLNPWRRFRWLVTDTATWLDFAWLLPGAITGFVLGLLAFAIPLYGLQGALVLPFWIWLATDSYSYGLYWPIVNAAEAIMTVPQGLLILTMGLIVAPWLRWLHVRFGKLLLAPSRATELANRVRQLTATRADTVDAQAAELRRIERDLHDGAQARLVSLSMTIGLAEELLRRDPDRALRLLGEAREASAVALVELRHLVRGIHPPVLAERGLDGAVRALALGLPLPVTVETDLPGRPETPVESAAYFAVAEALANVTRHSGARTSWVGLRYVDGALAMEIGDDGAGGADPAVGTGLRGIERRLAAFDGTMALSSPPGGPTVVTMELPCVLSSPKISPSSGTA